MVWLGGERGSYLKAFLLASVKALMLEFVL